jgi:Spy/CpxP family protein refolding chaperone
MTRRFLIAPLMVLTLAMTAVAQAPREGGRGGRGGPGGPGRGLDFLTGYLSLSDTQRQQAQTIFDAAQTASETARGQLTSARDALRAGVRANQTDAQLDQLAAAVGTAQGRIEAIHAKASAKFYALLTAEQKAKYDELGNRPGRP